MQSSISPKPVIIPLLNPNDIEGVMVELPVKDGQKVSRGDLLGVLETTKSTGEIIAEQDGYVVGLRLSSGQPARAGEILCYLASSPGADIPLPVGEKSAVERSSGKELDSEIPEGLHITQPALALARQHNLSLSALPPGSLITASQVRQIIASQSLASIQTTAVFDLSSPQEHFDPGALIVYGGGGHGKMVIELVRKLPAYRLIGIVDDGIPPGTRVLDLPVLGDQVLLGELRQRGVQLAVNAVGGIGNLAPRLKVFESLRSTGFTCPSIVHPRAFVEPSAVLGGGTQVFPQAYVGIQARVGFGTIINTGVIVSHDCLLGEYVNISPGAILAGAVTIGDRCLVGMGVTINLDVQIGSEARIGNGATVKADVPPGTIVKAGTIWPS